MDKGAHFFRCDFQVHTPRDAQWKGEKAISDDDRKLWGTRLIAACREKGLQAIAITDHHDVVMIPFARAAAASETAPGGGAIPDDRRIVVFPGVELTLSDPCQALLLFDADLPDGDLDRVSTVLQYEPSLPTAEKTAPTAALSLDLREVVARLNEQPTLRGRFIVLPNVTTGGTRSILRQGFVVKYREMPCVGGYVDGDFDAKTGDGERRILDGLVPHYGNKPLGVFQTSDCRSGNFESLGSPSTWVKWSTPTAEALRQSCLARQSRISRSAPQLPSAFITRVEVSNSKFLGKLNLFLNQQFNALIGGRGTGKSTLLEYLRWALCDRSTYLLNADDAPPFEQRSQALIEKTLAVVEGMVSVHLVVNGVTHVVRRRTGADPSVSVKIGDEPFRDVAEDEVRRLVPVVAFSQKELSSLGGRVQEMRQFLASGIQAQLRAIDADIRDAADRLRSAHARLQSARTLSAEEQGLAGEVESLKQQIESVKLSMAGVDPADAKVMADADLYQEELRVLGAWRAELVRADKELARVRTALDGLPSSPPKISELPDGAALLAMQEQLVASHRELRAQLDSWLVSLRAAAGSETDPAARFGTFAKDAIDLEANASRRREDYSKAKERMAAHAAALKQLDDLRSTLADRQVALGDRRRQLQDLTSAESAFNQAASDWKSSVTGRGALLTQEAARLESLSGGLVKALVRSAAGFVELEQQLADALRGSRIRGERIEAVCSAIAKTADPLAGWLALLDELDRLLPLRGREGMRIPDCPALRAGGLSDRDLRAVAEHLSADVWLGLRVTPPSDDIRFQYRSREDEYINFQDASAGQRATALLRVLLKQAGPPLLIDQPEDDLDNEVIHAVARDLWDAKKARQLVFSSHNANLVVNGDADLVVAFGYVVTGEQSSGEIKAQGAIDDAAVRAPIALVMEGGREAFELRKVKYGF